MDRSILFERYLDNLELYFNQKTTLDKKVRALEHGTTNPQEVFWQEYDMLDTLRELARRALDEYISTSPENVS